MKEVILQTRNIDKFFHDPVTFQVLKKINITLYKGEFISIVGKSGCGKSTLLYILSTMDTDYMGEVSIAGENLKGRSQNFLSAFRNTHIGFVFQFHYLLPEFSVLENVMIPALKRGKYSRSEVEDRAMEKLKMLGVSEQARKKASKLSGGQQQRVAIARALINDPDIIMGDEPTGNLDQHNSQMVFDIFRELTEVYGQSIIAVTHDPDFARKSDRIVEMVDGEVVGSE